MTTYKSSGGIAVSSRVGWPRLRTALALATLISWGLVKIPSAQAAGQIVQQFYVPFPETDFRASLQNIATNITVSTQTLTIVSIVIGATNTAVVYDHWEDGYENDLSHPTQPNTQIWGDGILTNGVAPGYTNDILPLGAVITLTNLVNLPRNPSVLRYDGRDRIGATKAVTVTRAGWAPNPGTLMASATEVYDTSRYGTYFIIPVGTNTTPVSQNFSYSSLHIIAAENGTVVQVDRNGDGVMEVTNALNAGESMFVNGGVQAGATVSASKPVQVHELTGRIGSYSGGYESRTFAIRPVSQWDTSYYAPVGTTIASYVHNVFIFNPYPTNITVLYAARTNSGSLTVTNRSDYKFAMPLNSGAHFYTTNGVAFYAVGANDTGSSDFTQNQTYDWGYALLPAGALTPVVLVGWAPGSDDQSAPAGPDQNGSPVWVTPTKATAIYVNYSGDYAKGPLIAPNGHHYDTNYSLAAYQFQTVYNPTTKNMTGARIFTVDGTTFAAAWGEDPSVAGSTAPYLDCGSGIIPFPLPKMDKSSQMVVDQNGDGRSSWGDTLEYTVHVQNEGMLALGNVLVLDALPNTVTYITNTTTLNGVPVADNLVPPAATAFPLDESGLLLPQIQVGGYSDIKYQVVINAGATTISNVVVGSTGGSDPVTSSESVVVAGPVSLAFTDASGNPVSSYVTNSSVYVAMTDVTANTNGNTVQTVTLSVTNLSNGDVESVTLTETGTNTGIFRNTTALPMSTTAGGTRNDGTLRAVSGNFLLVSYTDPISGNSGSVTTTVTTAPMPYTTKTSQLIVDQNNDGRINWGDTVEYSILLTNTTAQAITNLVVRDTLPTNTVYVSGSTTSNSVAVADSGSTPFPLDEAGLSVRSIPAHAATLVRFRVNVTSGTSIANSVTVTNLNGLVQAQDVAVVNPPPPTCNLTFSDAGGNPVSVCAENTGLYVTMTDSSQNTNASTLQSLTVTVINSSTGDWELLTLTETGANTGVFRNLAPLPSSTALGAAQHDGTLNGRAGQVLTVTFSASGGESCSSSAMFVPAVQTKKLYLSDPRQSLDRVDPVATGDTTTANTATLTAPVAATNATITLDTTSSAQTNASTLTFAHTTGIGTNRLMLIGVAISAQSVSSVSYNGLALTLVGKAEDSGSKPHAEIWSLVNPPSGTFNVVVTAPSAGNIVAGATTFTGVNQANALGTSGSAVGLSVSVSSATNEMVFDSACGTAAITPNAAQTQLWNLAQGSIYGGASTKPGSAGVTMSWTSSGGKSAIVAVPIHPAPLSAIPGGGVGFAQTPAFCRDLALAAGGTLAITGYVQVASGSMPATPNVTALLGYRSNIIATLTSPVYDAAAGTLGWSGILSNSFTVPAGQALVLWVTNNQSSVSFNIQYDSSTKPSAISLPTTTVISIDQLSAYDAPYPAGNLVTNVIIGQTAYVRALVSDPFGAYDVTSLDLLARDPGGATITTNLTAGSVVASSACSKTYEFPVPTSNWQGLYTIQATAHEGTEGITNLSVATYLASFPNGGTPSTTTFINNAGNPTNSYATNETVWVQVEDANRNQSPAVSNTVTVVITTTSGDSETITLTETGTNTGVFTGSIPANTNAASPGNGVLNAPGGAGLTVTYTDPLNPSDTTSDNAIVRMPPGPKPVLSLFKHLVSPANSTVLLNDSVQFNIELANPGSVNVTNVTLTDTFPSARLQFVSATIPPDSTTPAGTLTWNNLGPLVPGTNLIISTFFTAKMAGALTNSVSVTGSTNVGPVTAAATNNVSAIAVTKTLVSPIPGPAYINSNVVFRIAITNIGVNPITSYVLQDQFSSACFQFLGASVTPSGSGGGLVLWTGLPALAVGANTIIYVTNKVTGDCEPAVNNANISSVVDGSGNPVPNAQSSTSITNLGASISGTLWYDANANGTNDAGDSPLASANVYVDLNGDGVRQGNEPFSTADANGVYQIVSIPSGVYAARVDTNSLPAGVRPTYDLDGTNTPNAVNLTIANGQVMSGLDFGYVGSGSISGFLWSDINGDSLYQGGEPALNGVNVFVDLNANGVREPGEPYVTTAPDGSFAFNYLVATTYRIAIDILSLPPDMRPTYDLDGTNTPNVATLILGAGQNVTNASFGYQGQASLAGVITDGFTGLPLQGATVVVVDSLGTTQTVVTGLSGDYNVVSLWTGPATVTVSKIGYAAGTASPTIVAGANTQSLGLTPNTLSGLVTDAATSLPIAGATVVVNGANGTHTLITDAGGHYGVTNIATGAATVTASKSGYTTATASPTIVAGANTQGLSLTPNTLFGLVTDATSHQPIAGVTVQVVDAAGITNTPTTDATGSYSMTNIAVGVATITASKIGYNSATANPTVVPGPNTQDLQMTVSTPTLALLSSVKAFVSGTGVLVRWQTASEVGSVSFDLYRQGAAADQWIKVNTEPILAANLPTGSAYEVADAGAKPFTMLSYRIVELEEQGTRQVYGPFTLRAETPALVKELSAVTEQTSAKSIKAVTRVSVIQSAAPAPTPLPLSALDGSRFAKITTTNSGLQCVTAAALAALLGQAPADIQAAIAADSLRLSNQGEPVAYLPNADGSAFCFYAEALKNNYTAQNVYCLTAASAATLGAVDGRAPSLKAQSLPSSGATASYRAKLAFEQDLLAVPTLVQDLNQDYWMWQRLVAGYPMFDNAGFPFVLDHLSGGGSAVAQLSVALMGGSEATHTVQVVLNGIVVGQDTWQGRVPHNTVLPLSSSLLAEGTNHLTLKALPNGTPATSQWYLNGFGLDYPRRYLASGGLLEFTANSNAVITVDGFTSSTINVLDVTDPKQPAVVQRLTISPTPAGYCATFAPANPQARYVASQAGTDVPAPSLSIGQVAGWSGAANAADYLIITPDGLADAANTLASYRQQKGLRTAVVRLDQVYNEFSSGIATPYAIKQLLATALSQWSVKPRYAVLIGNGTYDYRDLLQKHDNLMPPLVVSTSYGLFCSDSAYGDVNGDGQPEIAIGRLPVNTGDQLLGLINKIKAYEAQPAAAKAQSLLVADAPNSAGNFSDAIQQVGVTLAGSYSNNVIQCASQSDLNGLRQAIQSSLNTGVDLVNYVGHGAVDRFGNAGYLTSADVPNLQNGARLPVVVAVTCVAGQYSVPGSSCLAENLLLQSQGGAIAVVAPTGLSVNQDASRLNLRLMQLLRANAQAGIGDLFRQALANHVAQDNPSTQPTIYNLMGDPATTYNVATQASSPIAAPRLTAATVSNSVLVITWSGGNPPFQLEQKSALLPGALWESLGTPVTGTSATVPLTGPAGFIRVRSGN
jgi:uncharacterized repeat protein (TIGR01451 family)